MWLIFRIGINLYYKLFRALYYPATLLAKRGFGLFVMAGILFIAIQFFSEDETESEAFVALPDGSSAINTAVTKHENGNSSFASDLLKHMSPEELHYYSQTYYNTMNSQPAGQSISWNYMNSQGQLTPKAVYRNNYGHACRNFEEILKVHNVQQSISGIACRNKDGGWCKLGPQFAPICGLAPSGGIGAWWQRTKRSLF
jgi:surface antigen